MTTEETVAAIQQGVTLASAEAQVLAPVISVFNPAIGSAVAILSPVAANFIVKSTQLIIDFKQDMSVEDIVKALNDSKSGSWPVPSSITPDAKSA